MLIKVMHRSSLQKGGLLLLIALAGVLLLRYPAAAATGGSRGLALCASVLIPSLFPFLMLSGFAARTGICRALGRVLARPFRWLFGLPGCGAAAFVISCIGGYPAGAMAIRELLDAGDLTPSQAKRLLRFCVNGGPAFLLSTVGVGMLHSLPAGVALLMANLLAAVLLGVGQNLLARRQRVIRVAPAQPRRITAAQPPAEALVGSVRSACDALLGMCGFVVLFSVVLGLAELTGVSDGFHALFSLPARLAGGDMSQVPNLFAGLLEVSNGCLEITARYGAMPFYLGFLLGFGGLSVHCQLAAMLSREKLIGAAFFLSRLLHGLLAGVLSEVLFLFVPPVVDVGAVQTGALLGNAGVGADGVFATVSLASGSVAASVAMLIMCAMLVLTVSQRETFSRSETNGKWKVESGK